MAEKLRDHRMSHSNINVTIVRLDQIYNEFASGAADVTAIRDFAKMLLDRSDQFKYLLLFGDGSFDYKNITGLNRSDDGETNNNIIPPYETNRSLHTIYAFPSDDYFGLLSEGEGTPNLTGKLDIAIGRLPFKNEEEATDMVDKIIHYDTSPNTLGDWKNRIAFVGDDEDSGKHSIDANGVSNLLKSEHKVYNHEKIFLDAYQQVSTSGGQRFPDAVSDINRNIFKGLLSINYLGHGGGSGWAQERILQRQQILNWDNFDKLPLMITATCSFTGYDDPNSVTAGELCMLNKKGGVIGLFTTVRAVFSNSNKELTEAVFRNMFDRGANGEIFTIGDISRIAKNELGDTENKRKFALIGDPSMRLALPKYNISTTKINGNVVDTSSQDTIQALQKVTIEGQIEDFDGNILTDFNGKIFPTIFDKSTTVRTLGQDEGSLIFDFDLQKNVIFKGVASVTNGKFTFTFIVPKDINYSYGFGKISYYAHDGVSTDAAGYYDKITIGGTNPNAIADNQPPVVEVYMNSEEFVFGGITDENPVLLVQLSDDNGINVVGNSIGHDLTGVLNENTQNTYILNDFYESALDDYTKGTVRYPLSNLKEGRHKIKVRAWDISNNSAEGYTEFIVANSAEAALKHVLNYPNPFMENTSFQFEHNLPNQVVDVQIRVFSVSGRLVKTIEEQLMTEGTRITGITWDGTDEYGDQLGRGVYLYKVKIGGIDARGDAIQSE
ncbi:MAG TPA: type IX secretion system sortase PorU, partial [Phaeodactylibacter sp.]|nr:type IX secretion system sortase PorU [Phaeodactylibacter sp.]